MWWVATGVGVAQRGFMIRPEVSNAVIVSILFSLLAGGAMLLMTQRPLSGAAAGFRNCPRPASAMLAPLVDAAR